LQTCGSVWACPCCSAKILAKRSLELGVGLLTWEGMGGAMLMGSLTMRHHRGDSLASEFEALNEAWRSVTVSRVWRKWRDRLNSPGYVRVVEVTFSYDNGWHVHIHFVLLVRDVGPETVAAFSSWLFAKWSRALAAAGMPGALPAGQDLHLVDGVDAASQLGEYLAKSTAYGAAESIGREFFGQFTKAARGTHGTAPAWSIAEQFGEQGEVELLDLWHEYEAGSKGRRQSTWTRGLRELLAVGVEKTDEEIAAEVEGSKDLLYITAAGWSELLRKPWPTSRVLDAVEAGGVEGLRSFLIEHGIEFVEVS
jgi:hypothetical protein